jgi:hypothetical protein
LFFGILHPQETAWTTFVDRFAEDFASRFQSAQIQPDALVKGSGPDASTTISQFANTVNSLLDVWFASSEVSRGHWVPFFPGESMPTALPFPLDEKTSAAISIVVFRASFHLLRKILDRKSVV